MRHAPLLLLLALGCSETPPPAADAQVAADLCVCQDGTVPPDVALEDHPDVLDAGGPDVVDAPAPVDAPDVVPVDAPELADVVGADAFDAAAPDVADAGLDAAVVDAPDVQLADVVADRPDVAAVADVVDAARDTGPVDAGPVVYDLNAARTGLSSHFAGLRTLPPPTSTSRECPDDPAELSCTITGERVNFSVRACYGTTLTGLLYLGDAGASTVSIFGGGGGSFSRSLRVTTGTTAGTRRSLHVQFAAPPFQGEVGFSGIPGRTVDPALADLWLLGCEVR